MRSQRLIISRKIGRLRRDPAPWSPWLAVTVLWTLAPSWRLLEHKHLVLESSWFIRDWNGTFKIQMLVNSGGNVAIKVFQTIVF